MKSIKSALLVVSLLSAGLHSAYAADTSSGAFSVPYIERTAGTTYGAKMINGGNEAQKLDYFLDGKILSIPKFLDGDALRITELNKAAGTLSVTKNSETINESGSGETIKKSEKSTDIKFRNEAKISLKVWSANSYQSGTKHITTIAFTDPLPTERSDPSLNKTYSLNINGSDVPLTSDNGEYADGKYYFDSNRVVFLTKNLTKPLNTIKLKVDGIESNMIVVKKEAYQITAPLYHRISIENNIPMMNWTFDKPNGVMNIADFAYLVNGTKLEKNAVITQYGQFTISYPLSKIPTGSVINISVADPQGNSSNIVSLNPESDLEAHIDALDLGSGKEWNFDFRIIGNEIAFFWDTLQLIVNINGEEYTYAWKRVTNTGWTTETKNQINIRKWWDEIAFNFRYEDFKNGENTVFIKNGNTGRNSNKATFKKWDWKNISFEKYAWNNTKTGVEQYAFEPGISTSLNNVDFITSAPKDALLGKMTLSGLEAKKFYELSFKIRSNTKVSPFSDINLSGVPLVPLKENDGTISYIYQQNELGENIKSGNLVFTINGLYNLEKSDYVTNPGEIHLELENIALKRANSDQTWTNIEKSTPGYSFNIAYRYDFWTCFEAVRGSCAKAGQTPPTMTINLSVGTQKAEPIKNPVTNTPSSEVRLNISWVITLPFSNAKFRDYNLRFKLLYEQIKQKNLPPIAILQTKKDINSILQALRSFEEKKSTAQETKNIIKEKVLNIKKTIGNE